MAQPFHAFRHFDKRPAETGQPAHASMHNIVHVMVLKVALPGVRLQLLNAE